MGEWTNNITNILNILIMVSSILIFKQPVEIYTDRELTPTLKHMVEKDLEKKYLFFYLFQENFTIITYDHRLIAGSIEKTSGFRAKLLKFIP